jgi:hypothetical protein
MGSTVGGFLRRLDMPRDFQDPIKNISVHLYHSPCSPRWTLICKDFVGHYRRRRVASLWAAHQIFIEWMSELFWQTGEPRAVNERFPIDRFADAELDALAGAPGPVPATQDRLAAAELVARRAKHPIYELRRLGEGSGRPGQRGIK